jgi:Recombinase
LIPVRELERFLEEHSEIASVEFTPRRRADRQRSVPPQILERIQREHAQGKSLGAIARSLTADAFPTAHGGGRWWPSTVRSILLRADPNRHTGTAVTKFQDERDILRTRG